MLKNFLRNYYAYILFFLAIFIINVGIKLQNGSDDTKYLEMLGDMSIFEFVKWRTFNWQPRIFSDFSLSVMYYSLFIWSIINSFLLTISLYIMERIVKFSTNINSIYHFRIFMVSIFFFIYPYVITSSVFWYTGSFNYLWPFSMMIIAAMSFLAYIYGVTINNIFMKIVIIIASGLASYTEQPLLLLSSLGTITIVYMFIKRDFNKFIVFQYIFVILNVSIYGYLSSFSPRSEIETRWFQNFETLSIIDKIFNGIIYTNNHLINSSMLLVILSILIFFNVRKNEISLNDKILGVLKYIPLIYLLMAHVVINIFKNSGTARYMGKVALSTESIDEKLFDITISNPSNLNLAYEDLIPSIISSFIILTILILLYHIKYKNKLDKYVNTVLFIACLCSGYIVGFSPTIIASGSRIFFSSSMLLILLIAKLYNNLDINKEVSNKISIILVLWSIFMWYKYCFYYSRGVLWF